MFIRGRIGPLVLFVAFCLYASGCTKPHSEATFPPTSVALLSTTPSPNLDPRIKAATRVQSFSLYQQAEQACRQKQYTKAAHLLQRLAAVPGLSNEEKRFTFEQRNLCLRDAGLPVPSHAAETTPVPTVAPAVHPLSLAKADCGPRALLLVCRHLNMTPSLDELRSRAGTTGKGTSMAGLTRAVQALGLQAEGVQVGREALPTMQMPAIAWVNERHFIAVLELKGAGDDGTAIIHDPNAPHPETISQERLLRLSSGYLLLVHR